MAEGKRQISMVVDLNKCMGCHTCTVACKVLWTNDKGMDHIWYMKVNTMPGRGYPKDWEQMGGGYDAQGNLTPGKIPSSEDYGGIGELPYHEVFFGGKGGQAHLAPKEKPTWGPNWDEDIGAGVYPNSYFFYMPRLCNHCGRPACAEACPRSAITKRDDGIVAIDEAICEGCPDPVCMAACPYKEIFWNPKRQVAQKCDGCLDRIEQGVAPACVRQCPGRMIWIDFMDNTDGPVYKLVKEWKVALPLHSEFGTYPNVFYVPPMAPPPFKENGEVDTSRPRIPMEELRKLFGPNVDEALQTLQQERERKRQEGQSELMDILIARRWQELLGPFPKDPSEVS